MKKMGLKGLFIIAFLCLAVIGVMASTPWVAPPIDHGKLGVADTSLVRSILQITTGDPETENTKIKDWIPCWGVNPWSKDGEWIVYQSRFGVDKQDFEICIIKPDGSGYKRLTENNDCDSHGNFTADGQRIIFQRDVEGAAEIWIMNKNGSGQQSLTQKHGGPVHPDGCEQKPLVSPDGTKILFRACTGDNDDDESGELWVMNIDGSNPVKVTRDINKATKHSWSPDSSWILFSAEIYYNALDDERSRIYKVRPNGKDLTQLSDNDKDYCENWAAWSPDGKWISYHRRLKDGDGDISDLWLMRADGSGKKVLVTGTNDALDPEDEWTCGPHSWHPSAQWIAFKRYVNGCDTSIYVINVKTGQIDRLTQGYADGRMWWSP